MILFPLTMHGGIKKGVFEIEKTVIDLYEEDGSLKLTAIFNLSVGAKIRFKLPEEEGICEGEVTNVTIKPNENIAVVGKINGDGKPGFIFVATTTRNIGGAIFFPEKGIAYALTYDDKKDVFLLRKQKLEVRPN